MKRLILVGGGHAHLEVLHALRARPLTSVEVVLIAPSSTAAYTGMVPGMLLGAYEAPALSFDLPGLVAGANGEFLQGVVTAVDGRSQTLTVNDRTLAFDACSLNVGSSPNGQSVTGMREHAVPLRPLGNVLTLRARFDALLQQANGSRPSVVVVGGGAAGVEVGIALALRAAGRVSVSLVHHGAQLLTPEASRVATLAATACRRAGVGLMLARRVTAVEPAHISLDDGSRVPSALTVWLTGAAPAPLLETSTLPRSPRGFLHVDDTLRACDGSPVWGAGDCAELASASWLPRAGVYAVRQGPVLARNLRQVLTGEGRVQRYRPQRRFLSLMLSGSDRAMLDWYGLAIDTRLAHYLKVAIDRRFMRRHSIVVPTS